MAGKKKVATEKRVVVPGVLSPRTDEGLAAAVAHGETQATRLLKAHVFGEDSATVTDSAAKGAPTSKAVPEDRLFASIAKVLPPPYDPLLLSTIVEQSSELGQCIDALAANIGGFGYRLVCRVKLDDKELDPVKKEEALRQGTDVRNFLRAAANGEDVTTLRARTRKDLEGTGNAYWELVPNLKGDKVVGYDLLPSVQMRLTLQDREFTPTTVKFVSVRDDGEIVVTDKIFYRRFRRFVQGMAVSLLSNGSGSSSGYAYRYFKEVGDDRTIDNETGDVVPPAKVADWDGQGGAMPESRKASAVLHQRIYSARSPYGIPRWIGNVIGILGVRRAEETNFVTLSNNAIPSMVITVSNGQLTEGTIQRIEQFVDTQIKGKSNYSTFLLLEGEGSLEGQGEDGGQVKIGITPLTANQHTDALFVNYMKDGRDSIRRCFRLPEIFVGVAASLNRATAEAARKLADEQIFAPERMGEDYQINALLAAQGFYLWEFKSQTPNVTDNATLIAMLAAADKTGALTPRIARRIIEDVFPDAAGNSPFAPDKFDPDLPFSITLAKIIGNQSDPSVMGQQADPAIGGDVGEAGDSIAIQASIRKAREDKVLGFLLDYGDKVGIEVRRLLRDAGARTEEESIEA